MRNPATFTKQRGVTLVELMISGVLGLIVLLGISSIFIMSTKVSNRTKNQISLDNQANIIIDRIRRDVYRAGYLDVTSDRNMDNMFQAKNDLFFGSIARNYDATITTARTNIASPFSLVTGGAYGIFGCDGGRYLSNPQAITNHIKNHTGSSVESSSIEQLKTYNPAAALALFNCDSQAAQGEGGIVLGYQTRGRGMRITVGGATVPQNNLASGAGAPDEFTGEGYDCEGAASPGNDDLYVFNSYYMLADGLHCKGSFGNQGVLLSPAAKHMSFRYRLTLPSELNDNLPSSQARASGSKGTGYAGASTISGASGSNWNFVTAVEMCLVMSGESLDGSVDNSAIADQPLVPTCAWDGQRAGYGYRDRPAGDKNLYKRYITTFTVPNLVYASPVGQYIPAPVDPNAGGNNNGGNNGGGANSGGGSND